MKTDVYQDFFLCPHSPRHKRYEMMRAHLVDGLPIREVAQRFGSTFYAVQSRVRDFKKELDEGRPIRFFHEPNTTALENIEAFPDF